MNRFLLGLSVLYGLVAMYCGFSSFASVWIGLRHLDLAGFWIPILAGFTLLSAVLWISLFLKRLILNDA
jgi:hypothetical protein